MSNWYAEDFEEPRDKPPDNPFAAGEAWQENAEVDSGWGYHRDGNEVVVSSGVKLPSICIKSGTTNDLKEVVVQLTHAPMWAFLLGGAMLAIFMQKQCQMTYFINRELSARYRNFRIGGILGILSGIGILFGAMAVELPVLAIAAAVLMLAGLVMIFKGSLGLAISRHQKGTQFWIKGFDSEFLNRLEEIEAEV